MIIDFFKDNKYDLGKYKLVIKTKNNFIFVLEIILYMYTRVTKLFYRK